MNPVRCLKMFAILVVVFALAAGFMKVSMSNQQHMQEE